MASIQLGPYILQKTLGKGAMGEVWAGVHQAHNIPVAIKILTAPVTQQHNYDRSFREEVRAVAALNHPNIVTIYDYGRVGGETDAATKGRYPEGRPYLVMEMVEGDSLAAHRGRIGWTALYRVLLALLDALGHAHARGLVHRDLKPHNVMKPRDPLAPTIKLADFGLAHALDRHGDDPFRDHIVGTPNYMAPEQIRCAWRDLGPWTDLYAVGCVVWALWDGMGPFASPDAKTTFQGHLSGVVPPLPNTAHLPPGFETWVRRLLEKDPARRYQRAADAAWALLNLAEGRPPLTADEAAPTSLSLPIVTPDAQFEPTEVQNDGRYTLTWAAEDWPDDSLSEEREAPPVPASWARDEAVGWQPLVGAGLGLFGMRTTPLVGRKAERNALWSALRALDREPRPHAIVVRGDPGLGKSRLVQWICERAHEFGAASVLRATHSPQSSPRDGIEAALVRTHVLGGLPKGHAAARMVQVLRACGDHDEELAYQLTSLLLPGMDEDAPRRSAVRRHHMLAAHLRRLGRQRPVILWIDDAQWGADAVAFTQQLLGERDLPVLVLLTVEGTGPDAVEAGLVAVEEHDRGVRLQLDPLGDRDMPALVHALIGLDAALAGEVQARSQGNPLFAVQLVGDWVERGALVAGPQGFELRGEVPPVPDGLRGIWWRRIDTALPDDGLRQAAEIAAALGAEIDEAEWRAALEAVGLQIGDEALDALLNHGLAHVDRDAVGSWRFAHGLLRESLLEQAARGGRAADNHRACAAALKGRRGPGAAERRARHLLAAGDRNDAVQPLAKAVRDRLTDSDFDGAQALFDEWQRLVADVKLAPDDSRRGEGWLLSCRLARVTGDLERARKLCHAAISEGERYRWPKVIARSYVDLAWDAVTAGDRATGLQRLEEAATYAQHMGDKRLLANCTRNLAALQLDRGDYASVSGLLDECERLYTELDHPPGLGLTALNRAQLARRHERGPECALQLDAAGRHFEAAEARWGAAMVLNERGLLLLDQGALPEARAVLDDAAARFATIGGVNAPWARLNRARVALAEGELDRADKAFTELLTQFGGQRRHGPALLCELGLMTVAIRQADEARARAYWRAASLRIDTHQVHLFDGQRMIAQAAELARTFAPTLAAELTPE